jgi:hypothetical protein
LPARVILKEVFTQPGNLDQRLASIDLILAPDD